MNSHEAVLLDKAGSSFFFKCHIDFKSTCNWFVVKVADETTEVLFPPVTKDQGCSTSQALIYCNVSKPN